MPDTDRSPTHLPTTSGELTPAWMTEALRGSGTIGPDAVVQSITVGDAGPGVGFMGEVAIVEVEYSGATEDAPATVVAKFPTRNPDIRAMMHSSRIYEREHRFYCELADKTPLRTPKIYHVTCHGAADAADERYMLLMENLASLTIGDQLDGVTPTQARVALIGLAGHHARFWNGTDLDGVEYIPVVNGPLNQAGQGIYDASFPGFMEVFGELIDAEMLEVAQGYSAANPALLDALAAMPHTLVHYDFRADNLFFDDPGGGDWSVAVIDWQSISRGGGAADVGYFLSQNLNIDDRREHEADLLHAYHDELAAHGITDYPFDRFFEDYRVGVVYGWIIPVMAIGSLDVSSERAMALWTAVINRVQAAVHDLGLTDFVR